MAEKGEGVVCVVCVVVLQRGDVGRCGDGGT